MATNFPGALDTLTNPAGTSLVTSPDHAAQHANANDAIESIQSKLGVGAGTPVANRFLWGSGNGTSTWTNSIGSVTITTGTINSSVLGSPTVTGGTVNSAVFGTPAITGGTVAVSVLGSPRLTLGSDATGDLYYRNAGGSVARIPIGTNTVGVLSVDSGTPSWKSLDGAHIYASTDQSIPNGTETTLTFDSEAWDTNALHGTANPTRLTVPTAGKWVIISQVTFAADADQSRYVTIRKNGATEIARNVSQPDGAFAHAIQVQVINDAAATDYYEVSVFQNGGGTLAAQAGSALTFFQCQRMI